MYINYLPIYFYNWVRIYPLSIKRYDTIPIALNAQ